MAITAALLASGDLGNGALQSLAAATLTANRLQYLILRSTNAAGGAPSVPTIADVGGRHFVPLGDLLVPGITTIRLNVFATMAPTTDPGVVVVVDYASVAHAVRYGFAEIDGVNTSGINGSGAVGATATNSGTGTTASTSQSFASALNGCIAGVALNVQLGTTQEAGWTELFEVVTRCAGYFRADNDTTPTATIGGSTGWAMISTELIAAGAAPAVPPASAVLAGVGALSATPKYRFAGRAELAGVGALQASARLITAPRVLVVPGSGSSPRQTAVVIPAGLKVEVL